MDADTPRDLDQLDTEALKALVLVLHEQVFSHQKQLTTQQEEIRSQREQLASRDAEIEHLKLLIAKLRRVQFGRSSGKRDRQIEQLKLRLEELEARRPKETAAVKASAPASTAVVRPVRRPLPDHLPREVRKYLPKQEACPDCGGKLKHLGEDVSEILEYLPASLRVIQYVRPKLACGCCDRIVWKRRADRSSEALLGQGFWRTCWYRNTATTCLSIVSRRFMLVPAWSWIVQPWRRGSANPAGCSRRWWKRCGVTSWLQTNYTRMTRPFRRWHQGWERPKRDGCGRTCATIVPRETAHPPRCGSRIQRIAKANIRNLTCGTLPTHCKRMHTPALSRSMKQGAFRKRRAGRTYGESFTISRSRINPPLRRRLWSASRGCMPSKKKSEDVPQTSGVRFATGAAGRYWNR